MTPQDEPQVLVLARVPWQLGRPYGTVHPRLRHRRRRREPRARGPRPGRRGPHHGNDAFPDGAGGYAELAVVGADQVAPISVDTSFADAAATPLAGGTAYSVLSRLALSPGSRLLVLGASGGVGLFLLQLAAAAGIETIAVGRHVMHDQMLGLGAAWCIDYASEDVGQRTISLAGGPVDAIADLVGGKYLAAVLPALRPQARSLRSPPPGSTSTRCSTPTSPSTACSSATTASEPGRWPRSLPTAPCGR